MNKDFLKFFELPFKKFLTRTSILVAIVSFHTSFATDAPSGASSSHRHDADSPNSNRRSLGRGFGNFPPKKLESRAGDLMGEIGNPASSHHHKSSERHSPPPDVSMNLLSPDSQGGASSSEESDARGSRSASIFSKLTKKEDPVLLSPASQRGVDGSEMPNANTSKPSSILSFAKFAKKEDSLPPRLSIDSSTSISGSGGQLDSLRRDSSERRLKKTPHKELTPEQQAAEDLAGKEAEERAAKFLENYNLKKAQEASSSAQVTSDNLKAGDESQPKTHDNLKAGDESQPKTHDNASQIHESHASPKGLASPHHGKKHHKDIGSPTSSTNTPSDTGDSTTSTSVSDPMNVTNPATDLPVSLTDVETSNFYPTPKSRHTGGTTLVRRISSVIGNHLFVRSVSKSAAAGDAGSEPVKFGFWGSANFDTTESADASVGSDNKTNTFSKTLGFDADIGDVLVGGAVSLSKNRLGYTSGDSDGDKVKTDSKVFTLYGTVDLNWGMFNKTLVSYGSTRLHSYSDNPGYGLAQSKYKQKMTSVQTELGYNYKTSLLNYLVSGGVRYIHTDTPEHTEWGAGIMNKTTKKDTGDDFEFIGSVGVNKLIKLDKYDVIPHLTFSARKKFAGQTPGTVYIRADSPDSYSLSGQNDKKFYSQLDLGAQVKYKSSILQLGMHYGFARKYSNIGGAIMLRLEI